MANHVQLGGKVSLKDAVLFLKTQKAGGTIEALAMKFGTGNVSWSESEAVEYSNDRGKLDDVREGDESPLSVTFNGVFTHSMSLSGEALTPYEILRANRIAQYHPDSVCAEFEGYKESWLVDGGMCPPYATELELHINPLLRCPLNTTLQGSAYLFRFFRVEENGVDISNGEFNVSGKCNVLIPTSIRKLFTYSTFATAEPLSPNDFPDDPREA
jgi:hypothetical protein